MDLLIAEDLLLLLLDDEKGSTSSTAPVATVLGGAVLVELALTERVAVQDEAEVKRWSSAKVRVIGEGAPEDPVLAAALVTVAEKERSAQDLVDRLGKNLRETLADRLVERGILERREDKVLGLFPRTRWPEVDGAHEAAVRRALTDALVTGTTPDQRTGALVALLFAIGQAHRQVDHDGVKAGVVKERAKQIAEGDWAAHAVKQAVDAAIAASTAAVAASTAATTAAVN